MTSDEILDWLDAEVAGLPHRLSGEELFEFLLRQTAGIAVTERVSLVGALESWIQRRQESETMWAVDLAVAHHLTETRQEIQALLTDVQAGKAFKPALKSYYSTRLTEALDTL